MTPADRSAEQDGEAATDPTDRARLLVVSTPIGNLGDLSARAREALQGADLVVCADTRRTGRLLEALGVDRPLLSLHEHNERSRLPRLLADLAAGRRLALVSDAGTPLLSDPGFLLVRAAAAAGVRVEPVPGASALLAALVVSGLPPQPFTFLGFPPPKRGRRLRLLQQSAELGHTLVLYESPHRLLATLGDCEEVFGKERLAVVARELTKLHEEVVRGALGELRAQFEERAARGSLKGEFVLLLASADFSRRAGS
ncbi:MAG: 16S rRNA (cytidine(1402)-2'-O)-methyltransferase [Acidobacteria bacterium]|nr:MAG: 16S rRNA (cytidine(1402)-2'-O)-methyltransferase [Acidobacteriota bacterium]